ncbi:MAG: DUF6265 family protein [Chitinophagales bacterium]
MRLITLLSIVLCITLACRYKPFPTGPLSSFNWLQGKWQEVHTGDIENWEFPGDSVGNGLAYIPNDEGEIVPNEIMQLVKRTDGFYFVAMVKGQNGDKPVSFKVTQSTPVSFIAENAAHDFPQRIEYRLKNNSRLQAVISGIIKGKKRQVKFLFKRL